jgi:hypothetical protein
MSGSISSSLVSEIRAEHEACERDARCAVGHAIRAGRLLRQVKGQLRHGEWLPWLATNVPFSQQTASAYMRIAENYGTSRTLPSSVNAALKGLAAGPTTICDACHREFSATKGHSCKALREKYEDNTISVYEIGNSERKRQIAEATKSRLEIGLVARVAAYADGAVAEFPIDRALAVATDEEVADWVSEIRKGARELNRLADRLEKARGSR